MAEIQRRAKQGLLVQIKGQNVLDLETPPDWFHAGQLEMWAARERFILNLAGTQSGKTSSAPYWLAREIQRVGPMDHGMIAPNFTLAFKKAIPEFRRVFENELRLGRFVASPIPRFQFSRQGLYRVFGEADNPCQVIFGYGEDPDSVESMTLGSLWCDESGQEKFKLASWQALLRRLSTTEGRVLHTTTPYNLGWIKTQLHDQAHNVPGGKDFSIVLVRYESIMNPRFPLSEWERAMRTLPKWKFDLFYRAVFTKPAGAIFDIFDEGRHVRPRMQIPEFWPRVLGMDFGNVNTAAVFFAIDPDSDPDAPNVRVYRSYLRGGLNAAQHTEVLLQRELGFPYAVGGARSEDEWRKKYADAGLDVMRPTIAGLEEGIDEVYALLASDRLTLSDALTSLIQNIKDYARELDDNDEPTEIIAKKATWHRLDALRYGASEIGVNPTQFLSEEVLDSAPENARAGYDGV